MLMVTFNQILKKNIIQEGNKITNIFTNVTVESLLIWLFNLWVHIHNFQYLINPLITSLTDALFP